MKFASQIITKASGSVGGLTASHNRGGMYMRARATPVNPNTTNQLQVRAAMTDLVNRWTSTLTNNQRAAWSLWADNTPFTDALGQPLTLTGQQAYIGANTARLQSDTKLSSTLGRVDAAPTIFNRGDFTTPTVAYDIVAGGQITFTAADAWVSENDAAMLVFMGRPQNASRNFFKGPFRLWAVIEGDATTPPTSPVTTSTTPNGYGIAAGEAVWTKVVVVREDGRYSSPRIVGPAIVT